MRKLEERFAAKLVVVGVHSGKFIAERVTENIRQAVLRLGLDHPVVNDRQFRVWRSFAVKAWPTLAVVDPAGRVVGQQAGEVTADRLAPALERVITQAEAEGVLDQAPRTFPLERATEPARPLAYPAKVLADGASRRLFLSDTSHQRVLVIRLDEDGRGGEVTAQIGRGTAGFEDGGVAEATFDHPHGLALDGGVLYVADTENHAIRAVDLDAGRVGTVAGTGEQARRFDQAGSGRDVALNSPWDVQVHDGVVYIALAGSHQIWRLDPRTGDAAPWAGSGAESLYDGPLRNAALSQPSGLASDGRRLFFADSEDSGIRWADLGPPGQVHTIVGTGLFDFGDRDGVGDDVRLQHPLGVAWHEGRVYVADTYNGKIKEVDPETREARSLLGGDGTLWEPGGLTVADGRIYIADSNHHRVVVAELDGTGVEEVAVRGV